MMYVMVIGYCWFFSALRACSKIALSMLRYNINNNALLRLFRLLIYLLDILRALNKVFATTVIGIAT